MKPLRLFLFLLSLSLSHAANAQGPNPPMSEFYGPISPVPNCAQSVAHLEPHTGYYRTAAGVVAVTFSGPLLEVDRNGKKTTQKLDGVWHEATKNGDLYSVERRGFAMGQLVVMQKRYRSSNGTYVFGQMALNFMAPQVQVERITWNHLDGLTVNNFDVWEVISRPAELSRVQDGTVAQLGPIEILDDAEMELLIQRLLGN